MSYTVRVPGGRYTELAELAGEQYGYITQADARSLGIPSDTLVKMARREQLERVSTGVYRMALIPPTPLDPYMQATLWPVGPRGILSHETALDLHALSDVNPAQIHLTVPTHHRPRRTVPRVYAIHHADLREDELTLHEGLPIVTPERAIRECHAAHLGPALIRQAIDDAERTGLLSRVKIGLLREELLGVGAHR